MTKLDDFVPGELLQIKSIFGGRVLGRVVATVPAGVTYGGTTLYEDSVVFNVSASDFRIEFSPRKAEHEHWRVFHDHLDTIEPVPLINLPLYIGWPYTYPSLEKELQNA